jgi:hypothetical protein
MKKILVNKIRQFGYYKITLAQANEIAKLEGLGEMPSIGAMRYNRDNRDGNFQWCLPSTGAKLGMVLQNGKRQCGLYSYHYAGDDVRNYLEER